MAPNRWVSESPTKDKHDEEVYVGEQKKTLPGNSEDFADGRVGENISMEGLKQVAYAARLAKISETTAAKRKAVYTRMAPGLAKILGVIITTEQPKTRMLEPASLPFPNVKIGETVGAHAGGSEFLHEDEVRSSCGVSTLRTIPRAEIDKVAIDS